MLKRLKDGCYVYENGKGRFYIIHEECVSNYKYKIYAETDYNRLHFITAVKYMHASIDAINNYIDNN